MNIIDISIIVIMLISCFISVLRGLFKEVISLASWVLAFVLSVKYASYVSDVFLGSISNKTISFTISLVCIFVLVLVIGIILDKIFVFILSKTGLGPFDKVLGIFFGFTRGVTIVCILVFIGLITNFKHDSLWQGSILIPHYIQVIKWFGVDSMIDLDSIKKSNFNLIKTSQP
ncbi:MAG: CvpA family protein [Pseudomonadota bacterium]|nr:CvpA family protein [Pseudomonadota bacterium]